jgi:UDP-N-acetylglucosamine 2-epimerase (non-hydrolysing)
VFQVQWLRYNRMQLRRTVLFIFGTRPEAIKLCPLLLKMRSFPELYSTKVCVTGQHRGMLDQVLAAFAVKPDYDLNVMTAGQTLFQSTARIIQALEQPFAASKADLAVVQGDTTTTLCGALTAFYSGVPVAHVEAGLRTGDLRQPFPEELNRVLTARMTRLHFAATSSAADNLRLEGISENVWITGNTGIDAVLYVRDRLERGELTSSGSGFDHAGKRLILVTAHRRESFGEGFQRICQGLAAIADRGDVHVVYPVHPNPNVQTAVREHLGSHPDITLTEPMDYVPFVDLMRRAYLILTDSGGIQEEGPSLGKPVLVLREKTERPEAVEAGTVKLVGTDPNRIVQETVTLLDCPDEYERMSRIHNPYGDGHASERIEAAIRNWNDDWRALR